MKSKYFAILVGIILLVFLVVLVVNKNNPIHDRVEGDDQEMTEEQIQVIEKQEFDDLYEEVFEGKLETEQ